jgi:hypothetical protein
MKKFTEAQVLEKIKAEGKTTKISDRTIASIVKTTMGFLGDDSEVELDDFFKQVMPAIKEADGNINHRESEAYKEWQKKNPQSEPEKKDKKDDDDSAMPQWYKDDIARREKKEKELEDKITALTSGRKVEELRSSALSKFKESLKAELDRNPKISQRLEKRYTKILSNVIDEDTVDTLVERLTEEFNDAKELAGDGYVPGESSPATGDGEKDKIDPAIAAGLSKITK